MKVPKNYLVLIAGVLWSFAGAMTFFIGIPVLMSLISPLELTAAVVVFFIFYLAIFQRLVKKHVGRIRNSGEDLMPFWQFFDLNSYIIMVIMMTGGITLRKLELIPHPILGPLYSGLGLALFACGLRFVSAFFRRAVYREA